MGHIHHIVLPGKAEETILSESGEPLALPKDWAFLPSGDAGLTRSVKAKGTTWVVRVRMGKRFISKGIWAKEVDILSSKVEIEKKRASPEYARRRKGDLARREVKQQQYVQKFLDEVIIFLDFHPKYQNVGKILAEKVTAHATPISSGTVARTERISLARRAEAAVIAWMRHQTTTYDDMTIARVKGRRREARRQLAAESMEVLLPYRLGREISEKCPLKKVLARIRFAER